MSKPLVEICVEGIDGLLAAAAAGADRVELCASLVEGGITPSLGTVKIALQASIPFHVIVRPRGGDFHYSEPEFASILADIHALRDLGVKGIVTGCLTLDGEIDEVRMSSVVEAAGPMTVTCHRAFDMTRDPFAALGALIRCGVARVLTSGQRDHAEEGAELLAELVKRAAGRIIILGCGGLDEHNIAAIVKRTGLTEVHFAALAQTSSPMIFRNRGVGMGGDDIDREYQLTVTDPEKIRATISALSFVS